MFEWQDRPLAVEICRFPGCRRPARRRAGRRARDDLPPLCGRHHRLVLHGGWRVLSSLDGGCVWTSPDGRRYHVRPRG
ncbi:MAG TPA: hypothetical protein VF053_15385 [Streptosporangiales bacterium]